MKKENNLDLLLKKEGKLYLSDEFHRKTNNQTVVSSLDLKETPPSWIKIHFKTYPRFEKVKLTSPTRISTVASNMRQRRSVRQFSSQSISSSDLSYILYFSCGLIHLDGNIHNSRRPYPSAGARYPLEVYPLVLHCDKLEKGLYHYNVKEHTLEILLNRDLSSWLKKVTGGQSWVLASSVIFIITAVLDRMRIKYGDRGYRFALLEAGHLGQNLCLIAQECGYGSCALGGYIDREIDKLLDVEHTKEFTLYMIAVGKI